MATAKDTSFHSQGKATTNILRFHWEDKTCKGKREFYPCGFKPGQSHTSLCYCADLHHYLQWSRSDLEAAVSEKALAPGHGGCSSMSWEVPTPSYLSQHSHSLWRVWWEAKLMLRPVSSTQAQQRALPEPGKVTQLLQHSRESQSWHKQDQPRAAKVTREGAQQISWFWGQDAAAGQGAHWTAAWGTTEKLKAE